MKVDLAMPFYGGKRANHIMLFLVMLVALLILIPSYLPLINPVSSSYPKMCPAKPLVNINEMREKLYDSLWQGLLSSSIILLPSAPRHKREESDMESPDYR
jgi:hypothetical protein